MKSIDNVRMLGEKKININHRKKWTYRKQETKYLLEIIKIIDGYKINKIEKNKQKRFDLDMEKDEGFFKGEHKGIVDERKYNNINKNIPWSIENN